MRVTRENKKRPSEASVERTFDIPKSRRYSIPNEIFLLTCACCCQHRHTSRATAYHCDRSCIRQVPTPRCTYKSIWEESRGCNGAHPREVHAGIRRLDERVPRQWQRQTSVRTPSDGHEWFGNSRPQMTPVYITKLTDVEDQENLSDSSPIPSDVEFPKCPQTPNPSIKRTGKGLRPSPAAYVKR